MTQAYMKFFPKPSCYPNQQEAMDSIHRALLDKKVVLFEGACGTGKTLSALSPSLDVAHQLDKVVIIATNVHQQMQQFVEESREIKQRQDIDVVVLKGKKHMCPMSEDYETCTILRENTLELIKKEKEHTQQRTKLRHIQQESKQHHDDETVESMRLFATEQEKLAKQIKDLQERHCTQFYRVMLHYEGMQNPSDIDAFSMYSTDDFTSWYKRDVRTPEEVNEWAHDRGMCGYELVKSQIPNARLLICNYHHILNPAILENLLGWMGRGTDEVIIIFDEAHNLESAARSYASLTLPEYSLQHAIEELTANESIAKSDSYRVRDMEILFELLLEHLKEAYGSRLEFGERERLSGMWKDISICDPKERTDHFLRLLMEQIEDTGIKDLGELLGEAAELGRYLDDFYKEQYKAGHTKKRKRSQLLRSAEFIRFYLEYSSDPLYYPMLNIRRRDSELEGRIELAACIPRSVTAPIFQSVYSIILMSATLKPFPMTVATLDIRRPMEEIAFSITFPEDNRLTIAINIPPLFARSRDDPTTIEHVTHILDEIIQHSGGNVLLFFQSYHEARMYRDRIRTEVPVYLDEVGTSSGEIRDKFFTTGESVHKAVIFSYLWGTLTEGVDYRNDRGRTVVIVGIGYPALNDRMRAIESAYEHEYPGLGWDYAIEVPTIRKVRQAMGRVIRSPSDYGARILLDGRYTTASPQRWKKYSVYNKFPAEERDEIIDVEPGKVKFSLMNFFNDMKPELS
ncbi:MAG: ATP-dependent DNA helicase [ANME-2 cluster archaeon]|nr:ATP-dependent DNA helicase [ANME-2 cluster archaeon]